MAKFKLGELAKGKPMDEAVYHYKVHSVDIKRDGDGFEGSFESGSIGYAARFTVIDGPNTKRNVFENLIVLDAEGEPSGALFRVAQFLCAAYGTEDIEVDPTDVEAMDALMEGAVGKEFYGDTVIEPGDKSKGYQDRNHIKAYAPIVASK